MEQIITLIDFSANLPNWAQLFLPAFVKGFLILLITGGIAYVLRESSAALRYMLWTAGVLSLVLLPVLSGVLPQIGLELLPAERQTEPFVPAIAPNGQVVEVIIPNGEVPSGFTVVTPGQDMQAVQLDNGKTAWVVSPSDPATAPVVASTPNSQSSLITRDSSLPWQDKAASFIGGRSLLEYLLYVWIAGFIFCILRLAFAHVGVWRISATSNIVHDDDWQMLLEKCKHQLDIDEKVRLRWNDSISVPFNAGIVKSTIFLPAEAKDWDDKHRRTVLLHELAHVKRADCLTHFITQIACAIHWANPLSWKASKQLLIERERACDDLVIQAGTKPSEYARTLLETARELRQSNWATPASLAMARKSQLESRLLAILDPQRTPFKINRATAISAMSLMAIIVIPVAMAMPIAVQPNMGLESLSELSFPEPEVTRTTTLWSKNEPVAIADTIKIRGGATVWPNGFEYHFENAFESNFESNFDDETLAEIAHVAEMEFRQNYPDIELNFNSQDWADIATDAIASADIEWADLNVNLPINFQTEDGRPDWAGIAIAALRDTEIDLSELELQGNINFNGKNHSLACCGDDLGFGDLAPGDSLTIEQIIKLKQYGVDGEFIRSMKAAGFGDLGYRDLLNLAKYGVDENLISSLKAAGLSDYSVDDVVRASKYGLNGDDIVAVRKMGYTWSLDEMTNASKYGVNESYLKTLADAGYTDLSASDVTQMAKYGVDPESINALEELGYDSIDVDDLTQLSKYGVDSNYIRKIAELGYDGVDVDDLVRLRKYGVEPSLISSMRSLGYTNIPVDDIINMSKHGVDAGDVEAFAENGLTDLSIDDLIELRRHGVDAKYVANMLSQGFDNLDVDEIVNMRKHGVDVKLAEAMKAAGYSNLTAEELVDLSRHGIDASDVESYKSYGFNNLSVEDLTNASRHGVDARYIDDLKEVGFDTTDMGDLANMRKHGVDAKYVREMREAGLKDITANKLIELRRKGVDPDFIRSLNQ